MASDGLCWSLLADLDTKVSDTLEIHFLRVRPQEKLGALLVLLGQVTA